jgi:hypothetical protein
MGELGVPCSMSCYMDVVVYRYNNRGAIRIGGPRTEN